jgi:hypothetical protein
LRRIIDLDRESLPHDSVGAKRRRAVGIEPEERAEHLVRMLPLHSLGSRADWGVYNR